MHLKAKLRQKLNKRIFTNFGQNHFVTKNTKKWRHIQSEMLHSPFSPGDRGQWFQLTGA